MARPGRIPLMNTMLQSSLHIDPVEHTTTWQCTGCATKHPYTNLHGGVYVPMLTAAHALDLGWRSTPLLCPERADLL